MKFRSLRFVAVATAAAALLVAAPAAANARDKVVYGFARYSSCKAEQTKAAYNNSFVRVSVPCQWGTDYSGYFFIITYRSS